MLHAPGPPETLKVRELPISQADPGWVLAVCAPPQQRLP
jgi:hypothetical protein